MRRERRAHAHPARPQPRAARSPASARASANERARRPREHGRAPGPVRTVDVLGALVARRGLRADHLTRALERRTVVQGTLLRSTIHLVSARDYWPFAVAIEQVRRESWLRAPRSGPAAEEVAAAAATLRERLADGPLRRKEIEDLLGKRLAGSVGLWLDLVRVPPSGTWERRRADLYGAAADWLEPAAASAEEGTEFLVRRYLGGFGPAAAADIANWAGLPVSGLAPALERLSLRRFRDEVGKELFDLARRRFPTPIRLRPSASSPPSTPRFSSTRGGPACSPSSTVPRSSARRSRTPWGVPRRWGGGGNLVVRKRDSADHPLRPARCGDPA